MTGCQVIQAHQARHPIHNTRLIALDQFDVHAWAPVSLMRFNPNGAQVDQQRLIGTRPPTWPTRPPGIVLARRYAQRVTQSDDWHGHTLLIDIGIDHCGFGASTAIAFFTLHVSRSCRRMLFSRYNCRTCSSVADSRP